MEQVLYRFSPAELAGIKRRQDEVLRFINAIAEIRELPDGLTVSKDGAGLCRAIGPQSPIPQPTTLQRSPAEPDKEKTAITENGR